MVNRASVDMIFLHLLYICLSAGGGAHSFHCHTLCTERVVVQVCGSDSVQEAIHTYIHSYIIQP